VLYEYRLGLKKPEETIIRLLQPSLKGGAVLDIGVGTGRTTPALSSAARRYRGIDYSKGMIAACRQKFRSASRRISFSVCDVRDMRYFGDQSFDVVFFSFNGLDYLDQRDRLRALSEIRRVCRQHGYFAFSTHNLQRAPNLFRLLPFCFPLRLPYEINANYRRRILNRAFRRQLKHKFAVFIDGAPVSAPYTLQTYYIRPRYQIKQLWAAGFTEVRVFSMNGQEIKSYTELDRNRDLWLYFMCRRITQSDTPMTTMLAGIQDTASPYRALVDSYPIDLLNYFMRLFSKSHFESSASSR